MRISNVDPPIAEPKRTTYVDLVNLPDPVKFGWTVRYFNHDDVTLYFKITGEGTGYNFGTVELGALNSGTDANKNLDEFASISKPSGERTDNIKLILRAYTDSGYLNLKWTFELSTQVVFIDSSLYTLDVLNNFDDGTVQGWSGYTQYGSYTLNIATDYVLSTPYSLKLISDTGGYDQYVEIYKAFTTPNKNKVYAILDVRASMQQNPTNNVLQELHILTDSVTLVYIGKTKQSSRTVDFFPRNKWLRIVIPLPKNTSLTIRVRIFSAAINAIDDTYLWMDDFKIVSKD